MEFKVFSMTGFSSLNITLPFKDGLNLTMTLKSLNSKYFEFNSKLPFALSSIETNLIKQFKSKLVRGNINFNLYLSNQNLLSVSIEPDFNLLTQYLDSIKRIQNQYNISGDIKIKDILRLPDIFLHKEIPSSDIAKEINTILTQYIEQLIESLIQERLQEGTILAKDIFNRIMLMQNYIQQLEPRALIIIDQKKEFINQTLINLFNNIHKNLNPPSNNLEINTSTSEYIALAIYNQLDKIDIHEEIVRFKSHLNMLINLLKADLIEKGKKIDFILQELFREINTITAKCADSEISNLAINIKVEIEKAREQAQNIV